MPKEEEKHRPSDVGVEKKEEKMEDKKEETIEVKKDSVEKPTEIKGTNTYLLNIL